MTPNVSYLTGPSFTALANNLETFKSYIWTDGRDVGFFCTRHWWDKAAERQGTERFIRKKLQPGEDPRFGQAARSEVMLPPDAPADYADLDFLLAHNDRTSPPFAIHAMMHLKIMLSKDKPWHAAYECVRSYIRKHFAHSYAVILITHIPARAGLTSAGNHVHCIVLPRPLSINGFGGACSELCSDIGYYRALDAWKTHLAGEEAQS